MRYDGLSYPLERGGLAQARNVIYLELMGEGEEGPEKIKHPHT